MKNLALGETVTPDSIRSVRPGYGLAPKHADALVGMRTTRAIKTNAPTSWDAVDDA